MTLQNLRVASPPADLQVAIYARVSSDQQAERHTIDSQLAELKARVGQDGHSIRDDMSSLRCSSGLVTARIVFVATRA